MVSPEKPIDEPTPESSITPPQEDIGTLMGRSITLGSVGDPVLSPESFSERSSTSQPSSSLDSFSVTHKKIPSLVMEKIQELNILTNEYLAQQDNKTLTTWKKKIDEFVEFLKEQGSKNPYQGAMTYLIHNVFANSKNTDPPDKWNEDVEILSLQLSEISKITPRNKLDLTQLLDQFTGPENFIKICRAEKFLTNLNISYYLFTEAFKKNKNVFTYLDYISKNSLSTKDWGLLKDLIYFLKAEIIQKPETRELYRNAIKVLANKLIDLEKSMIPKIKSMFDEKILNSPYMDLAFSQHFRDFNKLEEKIEFLQRWDRAHLRKEFIKKEDLSRIAEILVQTNDLAFVLPFIYQISKTYPSILSKIPSNSDFGKLLKNHLFEVIWKIPDPDSTVNRPSLEDYRSQDPSWRKRAVESIFQVSTAQQSFDFAASWLWFDESILIEFTRAFKEEQMGELSRMILKCAEKYPVNYLPIVKALFKNCPFAPTLRQKLMKDAMWTISLRDSLVGESFYELNLADSQELYYYFPNVARPIEMVSRRFEDRSVAPTKGGLPQNLGPEGESFALSAAASSPNISSSEKQLMDLLSKKFLDAGNIYNLNTRNISEQEKVALVIQNRIRSLGEIPDDLMILSLGSKNHAIVICLFKPPGSKDLKMLVTNTGLGVERHSKDTSTKMFTVTEETSVTPDVFSGPEGKNHLINLLLQPFSDVSLEDQERNFYAWVKEISGKEFPEKQKLNTFNAWYPQRHSQHGDSCVIQSVRQADKYLITRILWEMGKSKIGSDSLSLRKEFWKSYTRAQELLTHVDQTFLSSFPQDDVAVQNARLKIEKKGIGSFKEIAKDETSLKKAYQALDEAARRTVGRLSLPDYMDRKPEAYQLKERVKILTKSWQSLGYTYSEIETTLKDMKDEVIKVALARYKYMQATLDRVKDIFKTALTTKRLLPTPFTPTEMDFICHTLNQWPEKTLEEQVGKETILKLIQESKGEYAGGGIEDFASQLRGNRFYHLFKPLVKQVFEGITPFVAKHEYIDHFLKSITPQQREEIRTSIPYTNLFKSKMNGFLIGMAQQNPVQYPFAKERFLLYLSLVLTESTPPFENFIKEALIKIVPKLTIEEREFIVAPFADLARKEGKPWFRMTGEEKDDYVLNQFKEAA